MSNLFPNTPSITAEAEDPEMEQWAYEATAAIEAARVGGSTYLARMKDAGEYLTKARKKCQHGKWIPWLDRHNINRTTAFRAIKTFAKCFTVKHLDDAIGELAENGEEAEKLDPSAPRSPDERQYCSRNCRVGIGPSKCKECAKLNKAKPPSPPAPAAPNVGDSSSRIDDGPPGPSEVLKAILDQAEEYESLAKRLLSLSRRVRQIERSDLYRKSTGLRTEKLADAILTVSTTLPQAAPKEACPGCGGAVDASADSEPCDDCHGKGYLTAAEAKQFERKGQ